MAAYQFPLCTGVMSESGGGSVTLNRLRVIFLTFSVMKRFYKPRGLVFYYHRLDVSHMYFFFLLDIVWQTRAKLSPYLQLEDNTVWDI